MTNPQPIWQRAASFAARAHRDQVRKDGRTPYIAHPFRVAMTVACRFSCDDPDVLAAALLHDVIEDCRVDYDDLVEHFGSVVADLVAALSKDTRLIEPERERAYTAQLRTAPWTARLIKLADVYDNLIDAADADARRRCLDRSRDALELTANDPQLATARKVLADAIESVETTQSPR